MKRLIGQAVSTVCVIENTSIQLKSQTHIFKMHVSVHSDRTTQNPAVQCEAVIALQREAFSIDPNNSPYTSLRPTAHSGETAHYFPVSFTLLVPNAVWD